MDGRIESDLMNAVCGAKTKTASRFDTSSAACVKRIDHAQLHQIRPDKQAVAYIAP
jgi:hypothetical protein